MPPFTFSVTENFNQGECKCVCFSRSGLGTGKNIPSVENSGDDPGLNGSGGGVSVDLNGFKQFDPETKSIK